MVNSGLEAWLTRQWQHPDGWQFLLRPLSWLYGAAVAIRRLLYRYGLLVTHRLPVPVVVIGNVSVGGTGKTPLAIWLASELDRCGWHAGILIRGYGGSAHTPQAVNADSDPAIVGDEAIVLAQATGLPVWCGADRAQSGRALLAAHPQVRVLICDDGLQHLALARDCELALIDGKRGFGNGHLLPAGPLREPLARLDRVDAVIVHGTMPPAQQSSRWPQQFTMQLETHALYNLKFPERRLAITQLHDQPLHAVAGIGHPERFFSQLRATGLQFIAHPFPDHHPYRAEELNFPGTILMTAKDAVKCRDFATEKMWVWPVSARPDAGLLDLVLLKLEQHHG